jgi:hypothetical protein
MSEAAKKSYFYFSPAPGGEWREAPPEEEGRYWVRWRDASDASPRTSVVHWLPDESRVEPSGWELADPSDDPPAVDPARIEAWWSRRLEPPPTT